MVSTLKITPSTANLSGAHRAGHASGGVHVTAHIFVNKPSELLGRRCISKLSDFGHALPPKDPLLAQKIEILAAMLGKNTRGRGSFKSPSLPVENSTICET